MRLLKIQEGGKSSNGAYYFYSHTKLIPPPPDTSTHKRTQTQSKHPQCGKLISQSDTPHLIPPSLDESGFMEVECFTILNIVTTRKMTLTCQNRRASGFTDCT